MASAIAPVVNVIQSDPKVDRRYFDRISAFASDDQIVDRTTTSRRSRNALSEPIDVAIRLILISPTPTAYWEPISVEKSIKSLAVAACTCNQQFLQIRHKVQLVEA